MINISMTLNYVLARNLVYEVSSPVHRKTLAINLKTIVCTMQ